MSLAGVDVVVVLRVAEAILVDSDFICTTAPLAQVRSFQHQTWRGYFIHNITGHYHSGDV